MSSTSLVGGADASGISSSTMTERSYMPHPTHYHSSHAADQAGGEIVYASDGLEPVAPAVPPLHVVGSKPTSAATSDSVDGDVYVVDNAAVSLEQAFAVFSSSSSAGVGAGGSSSLAPPGRSWMETPWQRLQRLQNEMNALQHELSVVSPSSPSPMTAAAAGAAVPDDTLQQQVQALQQTLDETRNVWWPLRHEHLTQKVDTAVQGLVAASSDASLSNEAAVAPSSTAAGYPYHYHHHTDWEERLHRLEAAVGGSSTSMTSSGATSFMERLTALENVSAKLDDKTLEAWQRKAKTIRQDLEAAAKARNKLTSSSSNATSSASSSAAQSSSAIAAAADSKALTELYDLQQQLQGLVPHLPALAQRLEQLSALHTDAATWAARLAATESAVAQLQPHVAAVEQAVQELSGSLKTNAQLMQDNVKALDERIQALQLPSSASS